MSETFGMRAASMGASTLILAGLVAAALTASYTIRQTLTTANPPVVVSEVAPEPTPPPPAEPVRPRQILQTIEFPTPLPIEPPPLISNTEVSHTVVAPPALVLPEIVNAEWRRRPRDLARYYPDAALRRGVEGAVVLDCIVGTSGRLGCVVNSETPEGWGFANAALRIARDYEMIPATRDGQPIEARYRMRVPFSLQ